MATYNTKYTLKYCNRKGIPLTIEIQQRDYTGESFIIVNEEDYLLDDNNNYIVVKRETYTPDRDISNIIGSSMPFMLDYRNDKEGKLCNIMATSARMAFWSDLTFNIDDLKTSDETNLKVNFYYNNELEWTGFVVPDFFTEDIASISEVNLTASDRLGVLKDIPYSFDDTKDTRVSLMYILDKCIKNTGLDLPYEVIADFGCVEVSEFELYNPFAITYVYERRFIESESKNMNCYNIMQKILMQFNCRLVQRKGKWTIINKRQLETGSAVVHRLSSTLADEGKGSFSQSLIPFDKISTGGQRTIIPVNSIATVELNVGDTQVYPINRTFKGENGIPALTVPYGWTKLIGYDLEFSNSSPEKYNTNGSILESRYISRLYPLIQSFRKYEDLSGTQVMQLSWPYMQSKIFRLSSPSSIKIDFDFSVKAVGKPNNFVSMLFLIVFDDLPNKYFSLGTDGVIHDVTTNYLSDSFLLRDETIAFKFDDAYDDPTIAVEQEFKLNVSTSTNGVLAGANFNRATAFVRVYPSAMDAFSSDTEAKNMLKEVAIQFKSGDQEAKIVIHEAENEEGVFTKKYEAEELVFGDYETEGQNGYFYQYRDDSLSITYTESGLNTKKWFTEDGYSDFQPLLTLLSRQYARLFGYATDELNISFQANYIDPIGAYMYECFSANEFILGNGSIDYMRCEADVVLNEKQNKTVSLKEYIYTEF